jgi:hypothetical protein
VFSSEGYHDPYPDAVAGVQRGPSNKSVGKDPFEGNIWSSTQNMKLNAAQVEILKLVHNADIYTMRYSHNKIFTSESAHFRRLETPFFMGTELSGAFIPGVRNARRASNAFSNIASRFQGKTPVSSINEMTAGTFAHDFMNSPFTLYRQICQNNPTCVVQKDIMDQMSVSERVIWGQNS